MLRRSSCRRRLAQVDQTDFVTAHTDCDPMRPIITILVTFLSISAASSMPGAEPFPGDNSVLVSSFETESRYWIVSSRSCPQEIHRIGCCGLRVWSADSISCATGTCQPSGQTSATLHPRAPGDLRNALIPGIPVCVLVHGSYVSWDDVLDEGENTWRWLRSAAPERTLQFITYTWPSDPLTYLPNIDANVLGKRSGINGFYLTRLMQMIPPECPVCFIGHSHGTRVISSMLHLLRGGSVEGYCLPAGSDGGHRIRAVFAASAIDHDWLNPGNRYGNAISRLEGLMNLRNRRDWVLGFYPLRTIGASRALGRAGWTSRDYHRLGMQSYQLQELDVTCLIGKPHIWPAYYETPALAATIAPYIHFADEPVSLSSSPDALLDSRAELATAR